VSADRQQLETVLSNVVQNAYEAVRSGPARAGGPAAIRVSVRGDPSSGEARAVEIEVADSGPGMDEATLARAFVPFFTTKERGLGLGLALCERLTRAQGGAIHLRSKPRDGTTVTVRLPAGRDLEEAA
jgi:signal transduction histidine kinase